MCSTRTKWHTVAHRTLLQLLILFYTLVSAGLQAQASPPPPANPSPQHSTEEGKVLLQLPQTICSSLSHEMIFPIISAHSTTHAGAVQNVLLASPCKTKSVFVSFASFQEKVVKGFFDTLPKKKKKFSIFTLSTFASCNFPCLYIPVFWMYRADRQPMFHDDHLSLEE